MDFLLYCKENYDIEPTEKMIENYNAVIVYHQTSYGKPPSQKMIDSFIKSQIKEEKNENSTHKRKG